jgi:hypothetical protein
MPLDGGEETRVLDQPEDWDNYNWALVRNGIYFVNQTASTKQISSSSSLQQAKEF